MKSEFCPKSTIKSRSGANLSVVAAVFTAQPRGDLGITQYKNVVQLTRFSWNTNHKN